jgi:hypothetical protein
MYSNVYSVAMNMHKGKIGNTSLLYLLGAAYPIRVTFAQAQQRQAAFRPACPCYSRDRNGSAYFCVLPSQRLWQ